jgi:hypothetical protein
MSAYETDYLAVIGLASLDEAFSNALLEGGTEAALARGFTNLSADDRLHLDEFKIADPPRKEVARNGFAAARVGCTAVCRNPPCPYGPPPPPPPPGRPR